MKIHPYFSYCILKIVQNFNFISFNSDIEMMASQLVEENLQRRPPVDQEEEEAGMKSCYSSYGSGNMNIMNRRPKQSLMTRMRRTRSVACAPSPRKEGGTEEGRVEERKELIDFPRLRYVDIKATMYNEKWELHFVARASHSVKDMWVMCPHQFLLII